MAQLNVTPTTTWSEINELCKPAFEEDKDLGMMDPMDKIISFEDYVMTLDSQYKNARNLKIKLARREERKQRDNFKELLQDMKVNVFKIKSKPSFKYLHKGCWYITPPRQMERPLSFSKR